MISCSLRSFRGVFWQPRLEQISRLEFAMRQCFDLEGTQTRNTPAPHINRLFRDL